MSKYEEFQTQNNKKTDAFKLGFVDFLYLGVKINWNFSQNFKRLFKNV